MILATGGLYGGGLESSFHGRIWETMHNIPVVNIPPLGEWFSEDFLSARPQPIHRVGVATDAHLRPLNAAGNPVAPNLFAVGRLLAGYSW